MLFSLGQSSDCFAILRNLLKKHTLFPAKRPADAKEILGLRNLLKKHTLFPKKRPADAMEILGATGSIREAYSFPCRASGGRYGYGEVFAFILFVENFGLFYSLYM